MKFDLTAPDHSTLSRQRNSLTITLPVRKSFSPRNLVVDSTGFKVYGEGEWKARQHGVSKLRTCIKLHLCSDEAMPEVISAVAGTNDVSNAEALTVFTSGWLWADLSGSLCPNPSLFPRPITYKQNTFRRSCKHGVLQDT